MHTASHTIDGLAQGKREDPSVQDGPRPLRRPFGHKHPLRRRGMYLAFVLVRGLFRWLPLSVAQALGRLSGYVAYAVLGRYRRLCLNHLHYAFGPAISVSTCQRITRGAFINLAKSALEWCVLGRFSSAQIRRLVDIQGLTHLTRALRKGKGVIVVSAHFGNWEVLAMTLPSVGFPGGVLARPLRYPEYERFLREMRQRNGVPTLDRGSLKEAAALLKANQIVGVMPDQDVDRLEGVFVDFFGHPTYTPVGPAALSLLTGAPILPCFIVRQGRRFRVMIEEPIAIMSTGDRKQDLLDITEAWSRVVESYIRRHPDHWVWMHRRWKTQPGSWDGEPPVVLSRFEKPQNIGGQRALPVGVAGLFAVGCVLCAGLGCGKPSSPSATRPSVQHSSHGTPEQTPTKQMDSFTMIGYASDGTKRWELEGQGASAEGVIVTVQQPRGVGFEELEKRGPKPPRDVSGEPAPTVYLSASVAHVDQTTRRVHLEHDVIVHTADGLWLMSPHMYWLPDQEEMATDHPVRIETDHMVIYGRGATAHSRLKTGKLFRDIWLVMNTTDEKRPGVMSRATIACDGPLSFDYEQGIAVFERNVHVIDAQGDLYSDRLVAYVDSITRTMTFAQANGHVRIVQGPHTARGERAVYEPRKSKITLLDSPSLVISPGQDRAPVGSPSTSRKSGSVVATGAP